MTSKPHRTLARRQRQPTQLWTATIVYKGCTDLAESYPSKTQAQGAIIDHLQKYHLYNGPRNFGAAMNWIAERDDCFDVQIFAHAVRQPTEAPAALEDDPSGLLTVRQKQIYLRHEGNRCPLCRSHDIEGTGTRNYDGDWCTNKVECRACGVVWEDIYTLSDLQITHAPTRSGRMKSQTQGGKPPHEKR